MVMADFSGSEAEELRRALSFHRSQERMDKVCVKLRSALDRKGVKPSVRDQLIQSVQSFAVYGFPESHAISFATIAYASCWLKVHRTPEFYCGLLNNMPMGFYSENTLLQDARQRGVRVRPISVLESGWLCRVDEEGALRLGLRMVRGVSAETGRRIAAENARSRFTSLNDLRTRARPGTPALRILARIGALNGLVAHRRDGLWKIETPFSPDELPLFVDAESSPLETMSPEERLTADFADTRITTGPHPMRLLRAQVPEAVPAADLPVCPANEEVEIAGMVICRQRPGTARGVVFVSLEDETGIANAILHASFFEKHRLVVTQERFLRIRGKLQRHQGVIHVLATGVEKLGAGGPRALADSHDFR